MYTYCGKTEATIFCVGSLLYEQYESLKASLLASFGCPISCDAMKEVGYQLVRDYQVTLQDDPAVRDPELWASGQP